MTLTCVECLITHVHLHLTWIPPRSWLIVRSQKEACFLQDISREKLFLACSAHLRSSIFSWEMRLASLADGSDLS